MGYYPGTQKTKPIIDIPLGIIAWGAILGVLYTMGEAFWNAPEDNIWMGIWAITGLVYVPLKEGIIKSLLLYPLTIGFFWFAGLAML